MWFLWITTNLMDRNKIKQNSVQDADTRSLINRICKRQAIFFGYVMRREILEHLDQRKTARRYVG